MWNYRKFHHNKTSAMPWYNKHFCYIAQISKFIKGVFTFSNISALTIFFIYTIFHQEPISSYKNFRRFCDTKMLFIREPRWIRHLTKKITPEHFSHCVHFYSSTFQLHKNPNLMFCTLKTFTSRFSALSTMTSVQLAHWLSPSSSSAGSQHT